MPGIVIEGYKNMKFLETNSLIRETDLYTITLRMYKMFRQSQKKGSQILNLIW